MSDIKQRIWTLLGRRDIQHLDVILCAEVGSRATGTGVGTDDDDFTVVRMEGWREFVSQANGKRQSMMVRTQPDGHRSRLGDIDLNVYTLRRFANLAAKGNPSILGALFSPNKIIDKGWLKGLAEIVASKASGHAYLGYMRQQMERWRGERGQKNVTRPELVEQYGFDTKYAGHVIRLGFQGTEYLGTGRLTLPMPEAEAAIVRECRTGGMTEQEALDVAETLEACVKDAFANSPLPEAPGIDGMNRWLAQQYGNWYDVRERTP